MKKNLFNQKNSMILLTTLMTALLMNNYLLATESISNNLFENRKHKEHPTKSKEDFYKELELFCEGLATEPQKTIISHATALCDDGSIKLSEEKFEAYLDNNIVVQTNKYNCDGIVTSVIDTLYDLNDNPWYSLKITYYELENDKSRLVFSNGGDVSGIRDSISVVIRDWSEPVVFNDPVFETNIVVEGEYVLDIELDHTKRWNLFVNGYRLTEEFKRHVGDEPDRWYYIPASYRGGYLSKFLAKN